MLKNNTSSYGSVAKFFHWTIGLTIICMLMSGFFMTFIAASSLKWSLYNIHKAFGVITLTLVVLRVLWRLINQKPQLPENMLNWQKVLYNTTHCLLYLLMFLMPISGLVMSLFGGYSISIFGVFSIPAFKTIPIIAVFFNYLHTIAAFILIGFIVLHIIAALYHHFYLRDNILKRMI